MIRWIDDDNDNGKIKQSPVKSALYFLSRGREGLFSRSIPQGGNIEIFELFLIGGGRAPLTDGLLFSKFAKFWMLLL